MSRRLICLFVLALFAAAAPQGRYAVDRPMTFGSIDIYVDAGHTALAAWQISLGAPGGGMQVIGVENGEHPAYAEAPWYDRKAVEAGRADRLIVGSFTTREAKSLPVGKTRVTTIHLCWPGAKAPEFEVKLDAAAGPFGKRIGAKVSWVRGTAK